MQPLVSSAVPTPGQRSSRETRAARLAEVGPLLAALVRRLGLPGERDDQLQSVAAHVLEVMDRFDPRGTAKFSTWVTTVASRWLLMQWRRSRPELVALDDQPLVAAPSFDPALLAESRSLEKALERALTLLPPGQRRAFVLASVEQLPLDEVAAIEDVPVGTIKSRLARARMALATTLGPALGRSPSTSTGGSP